MNLWWFDKHFYFFFPVYETNKLVFNDTLSNLKWLLECHLISLACNFNIYRKGELCLKLTLHFIQSVNRPRRKRINQKNVKREARRGLNEWPLHLLLSPRVVPSEEFLVGGIAWQCEPIYPLFVCRSWSLYRNIGGEFCADIQNCCNCSVSLILLSFFLEGIGTDSSSCCPLGLSYFHYFILLWKKLSEINFLFIVASKYALQS